MYIDLTIINAENLKQKAYITFYFEGVRQRIYSGRAVGLMIFPNRAKTVKVRVKRLEALKRALIELVENESYPYVAENGSKEADKVILLLKRLKENTGSLGKMSEHQLQELKLIQESLSSLIACHVK